MPDKRILHLLAASAGLMLAADRLPFSGVWLFPGPPAANQPFIQDGFYHCPACNPAILIPADGKEHPLPSANGASEVMSVTIVSDHEVLRVIKQGGKERLRVHTKVSPDGKSLHREVTDHASGEPKLASIHGERTGKARRGHLVNGPWQFPGQSVTYEESADGLVAMGSFSYRARFDGKPHPMTLSAGPQQTVVIRRIHSRRIEEQFFLDGKPEGRTVMTVSRDGKTLTNDYRGADGKRSKIVARRVGDPPAQN